MRIVMTGGTGFIGRPLCQRLVELGHAVTVLTRGPAAARARLTSPISVIGWQGSRGATDELMTALRTAEVVINLAGAPIAEGRWTDQTKDRLRRSREGTTSALVAALAKLQPRPVLLISASAIGYYGPRQDDPLTEEAQSGTGFLASLCREWEAAARAAERLGVRVALPRIGVVLGRNGGALARMLPVFRLGLGGPLGTGTQWLSWIHLDDLIELLLFLLREAASGPVNATAPQPVTNEEFSRVLGQTLGRPAWFRTPAFALKLLLGQMAEELLLTGQRVLPAQAEAMGFRFQYPTLSEALHAILH
ncbi:MAG TPA: TIGR01777 family oxidoreductase [Nitrospiraceae bacterium]|nr:TIGR01777 family oxidoreductase [Nitrospiraceae bacterium]